LALTILTLIAAGLAGCLAASGQARQGTAETTIDAQVDTTATADLRASVDAAVQRMDTAAESIGKVESSLAKIETNVSQVSNSVNDPWTFRILALGAFSSYFIGKIPWAIGVSWMRSRAKARRKTSVTRVT